MGVIIDHRRCAAGHELGTHTGVPQHIEKSRNHVGADLRVCPIKLNNTNEQIGKNMNASHPSIPTIVQWFKTMTTNEYIRRVKNDGWKPFNGKLWQRNYYEHIIRKNENLNEIREYINNNPLKWELDDDNPIKHNKSTIQTRR